MSFNQNNSETREDGMTVVQHAQPQTLHTRDTRRLNASSSEIRAGLTTITS